MKKRTLIEFTLTFFIFLFFAYALDQELPIFSPLGVNEEMKSVEGSTLKQGLERYLGESAKESAQELPFATLVSEKGKIVQIEVNKKTQKTFPFVIGDAMSDISTRVLFQSRIPFERNGVRKILELDDGQINYSPVYKYSDNAFAVLNFSKETGRLAKIRYVNAKELLALDEFVANQ